jgi:hypothetical protein
LDNEEQPALKVAWLIYEKNHRRHVVRNRLGGKTAIARLIDSTRRPVTDGIYEII